jgi:hypothetical protein
MKPVTAVAKPSSEFLPRGARSRGSKVPWVARSYWGALAMFCETGPVLTEIPPMSGVLISRLGGTRRGLQGVVFLLQFPRALAQLAMVA